MKLNNTTSRRCVLVLWASILIVSLNIVHGKGGFGRGGRSSRGSSSHSWSRRSSHSSSNSYGHSSGYSSGVSDRHNGLGFSSNTHHTSGISSLSSNLFRLSLPLFPSNMDHHKSFKSVDNYRPVISTGGTFYPPGSSLPHGAVYHAQPSVMSSRSCLEVDGDDQFDRNKLQEQKSEESSLETTRRPTESDEMQGQNHSAATETTVSAQNVPDQLPPHGVICVAVNETKSDTIDSAKTIDVEQIACYPATCRSSKDFHLNAARKAAQELFQAMRARFCNDFENGMYSFLRSTCQKLQECNQLNVC